MTLAMLKSFYTPGVVEAGLDEAGRGCLAGPVFAAAVILPPAFANSELNDSKQLSERTRFRLRKYIEAHAIDWAIGVAAEQEIDEMNILRASILAMHRAIDRLKTKPGQLLVDGNRFYAYPGLPHFCLVKGDSHYASIAAASVLAKTARDAYMVELDHHFPAYGWRKNKGYPTALHRLALKQNGPSPHHRKSFSLFGPQLEINF